jgi:hypothetical protein
MRREILEPADRVVQGAVRVEIDRIDREIAARRVFGPVGIEGHLGVPAVGLDIAPQGGDLEMSERPRGVDHRCDRAVGNPGRHRLDPGLVKRRHDCFRPRRGGKVDISDHPLQQRIAHTAADKPRGDSRPAQRG